MGKILYIGTGSNIVHPTQIESTGIKEDDDKLLKEARKKDRKRVKAIRKIHKKWLKNLAKSGVPIETLDKIKQHLKKAYLW